MTAEELYNLYVEGNDRNNCMVEAWDDLEDQEKEIWRYMADKINESH